MQSVVLLLSATTMSDFTIVEFIELEGQEDPICEIVGLDLPLLEIEKIIQNRPIEYFGSESVVNKYYKAFPTEQLFQYMEEPKPKVSDEFNVNGLFSIEANIRRDIEQLKASVVLNARTIELFNTFSYHDAEDIYHNKIPELIKNHKENVKMVDAGIAYLAEITAQRRTFVN